MPARRDVRSRPAAAIRHRRLTAAGLAGAAAFEAMLGRLQALDLIAWERFPSEIEITVASDASQALVHGP